MRVRVHMAAVAALALAAACAAPPPPTSGTAADETAIRGLASQYAELYNKNDVAGLSALLTDDFQATDPDGTVVTGRAAWEEREKKLAAARAGLNLKLDVQTTYVNWMSGTSAVAGGTWTMAGVPAGGPGKGAWLGSFKKGTDGQWKMANGLVADYVPPPAPPAPPATGK